ncbi:hypothetical protein ACFFX0_14670 [Citricoccus parietis]|uniref:Uncharacterized protein n=1 Tax=Citricoccus parietis TaxID=592307 RepID=A0ABV5G0C0_9MICC
MDPVRTRAAGRMAAISGFFMASTLRMHRQTVHCSGSRTKS